MTSPTVGPEGAQPTPIRDQAPTAEPTRRAAPAVQPNARRTSPVEPAVVLEHVSKLFDDVIAVEDVSLMVPPGVILGVIGPSGSGKTTTIRMLTGGLRPTSGAVHVLGRDPGHFPAGYRRRIGYMPQAFAHYPDLSTRENVDFVASLYGLGWFARRRRVPSVLRTVDLWGARARRAGKLSGGMQRRLELACALVHDPALLFLDEPTAGLDPLLRASIWEELHRLRDSGRTLLVTTQYVNEAEECDAVALISRGRLLELAPPDELRRRAAGGDLVEVVTDGPIDAGVFQGVEGVTAIRTIGPNAVRLTVDDAGLATPAVIEAVSATGRSVESAREARLSFDEVFAALVEADERAREAAGQSTRRQAEAQA